MARERIGFVCSACGYDSPKWSGKCPSCGEWNTMVEQSVPTGSAKVQTPWGGKGERAIPLDEIEYNEEQRIDMRCTELNRVLGGGLVRGSLVLLGGEPGIGKSTLILQTVMHLEGQRVLYVSGEESAHQIKMRATRIKQDAGGRTPLETENLLILCETNLENILAQIKKESPTIIVIDSIQTINSGTVESQSGSITQVRECASQLLKLAKQTGTPIIVIGHITKDGAIAGPKILEHIVDAVLQFEGDQHYMYRLLRAIKNRFGSTAELGIYEMCHTGLRAVENPSELLLSEGYQGMGGVAIAAAIEGVRPLLIEAQSLVSSAVYGTPQRSAIGFDVRRMNMLLAVLERRAGFKLGQKDVFFNIAGGIRVSDPAIDLAVMSSILSSNLDISIERTVCMAGEIGLSGEIRPVSRIESRISEAQKLGFERIIIPKNNLMGLDRRKIQIELLPAEKVEEAFKNLFG